MAYFTYFQTNFGWVYIAFVIDAYSLVVVDWKVSTRTNTDLVLAALEQAIYSRDMPENVIHYIDRGMQY